MKNKVVTVVGGTGFVGRYVVQLLASKGYIIRVISRNPTSASHLKTSGDVGQVVLVRGDLASPENFEKLLAGSYAVINLVGILFESGMQDFSRIHAQGAEKLAKAAKAVGAKKFIQISAIGVDHSVKSKYARTKALGEKAVLAAFPKATILRPSIIFGAEDNFFNKFAQLASLLPFLPLFGGGKTLFQPVYVEDVAAAISNIVEDEHYAGKIYELGGPEVMSLKEIYSFVLETTGINRQLIHVPFAFGEFMGLFAKITPELLSITRDQVKLLHYDNIVSEGAKTLVDLGVNPTPAKLVVPGYLARYKKRLSA